MTEPTHTQGIIADIRRRLALRRAYDRRGTYEPESSYRIYTEDVAFLFGVLAGRPKVCREASAVLTAAQQWRNTNPDDHIGLAAACDALAVVVDTWQATIYTNLDDGYPSLGDWDRLHSENADLTRQADRLTTQLAHAKAETRNTALLLGQARIERDDARTAHGRLFAQLGATQPVIAAALAWLEATINRWPAGEHAVAAARLVLLAAVNEYRMGKQAQPAAAPTTPPAPTATTSRAITFTYDGGESMTSAEIRCHNLLTQAGIAQGTLPVRLADLIGQRDRLKAERDERDHNR